MKIHLITCNFYVVNNLIFSCPLFIFTHSCKSLQMEVPILRIPGITRKAMLLRIFICNREGRELIIRFNRFSLEIPCVGT